MSTLATNTQFGYLVSRVEGPQFESAVTELAFCVHRFRDL